MKRLVATGIVAAALLLGACSGGGYGSVGPGNTDSGNLPGGGTPPPAPAAGTALFQVNAGVLPYPTDLYFAGSTDGTINIQPPNPVMPNQAAINGLDGFSTTAVIRENFGGALDPTSFTPASVIVVPVVTDNLTKATIGVVGTGMPLTPGVDYTVGPGEEPNGIGAQILEIKPLHPLMASSCLPTGPANCKTGNGYLVILTDGIKDTKGNPAVPDTDYANIKAALAKGDPTCPSITDATLNGVCQLTGAQLQIAQALGLNPAHIVLTFSFTTQSTLDTLTLLSLTTQPQTIKVNPTGKTTHDVNPLLPGYADVYVGVLTVPYYLSKSAPLTEYWHAPPFPLDKTSTFVTRFNPLPAPTQTLQIPVLVTVPNASSGNTLPAGGWPVTIFQHGITRSREDMFGIADSFAASGSVVIAIDLPLHGVTNNTTDPLYAAGANPAYAGLGLPASGSIERTFDLSTIAPPQIDPSGSHFINLTSVLTSRDNLRQGAADLIALVRTLPQLNLGGASIDPTKIHFLGHSLGSIVGGVFLGVIDSEVTTATLAVPGGGIADLLRESPTFAPQINQGLESQGVYPGTTLYEQFFRDAQTAVDSGDPINFIADATAAHPIHLIQVIGSSTSLPDQVVPNVATQRLITASGYCRHPRPRPRSPSSERRDRM